MDKFIVLAIRRSGVTFFLNCLDSHPQIRCYKKVFLTTQKYRYFQVDNKSSSFYKFRSASTKRKIAYILRRKQLLDDFMAELYTPTNGTKATLVRLAYLQAHRHPRVLEWALENDIGIIHLVRENSLKTLVSHYSSQKRGIYHSTSQVAPVTVRLSPAKLKRNLAKLSMQIEEYRALLAGKRHLEVCYESFTTNRDAEARRVLDFIGVDQSVPLTSDLVKLNPDSLEDIIENYAEIAQAFRGTAFEKYLTM